MTGDQPTLVRERELLTLTRTVIGCDEVGRGAVAGPVAVGAVAVDSSVDVIPEGLRDSKLLTPRRREVLRPIVEEWVNESSVGTASAEEIDAWGITYALGLAARRALVALHHRGVDVVTSAILLDGDRDYLSAHLAAPIPVHTVVKGDRDCASASAASVIAKVTRDAEMCELSQRFPQYEWESNKGYGSRAHLEAVRRYGVTAYHRRRWLTKHVG